MEGIIRKSIHPLGLAVLLALAPTAEDLNNKYIREIKVGETLFGDKMPGAVTATFYNDEPSIPELRGKKISIMPINSRYQ